MQVQTVLNGIILPLKKSVDLLFGAGGVIDCENKYVPFSGISGKFGGYYDFFEPIIDDRTVVYCGYLEEHWGHFLIDSIVRLWYIIENNPKVDKYVFAVASGKVTHLSGNIKDFFDLLGLSNKLEFINKPTKFSRIIIPEVSFQAGVFVSSHYRNIFNVVTDNVRLSTNIPSSERIFLSRSRFKKARRTEAGIDMLDNFFEKNGYKIIFPELLSLSELICYLQNANECACASGTLPHNILFAKDDIHLTVVERQPVLNIAQCSIDFICNISVSYIDGFYSIFPVSHGFGPYFFAYNKYFKRFAEDTKLTPPDTEYKSECYLKKCLRLFFKVYKYYYPLCWYYEPWYICYTETIFEAVQDSQEDLGEYLLKRKIFSLRQVFEWWFIKQFIKNLLLLLPSRKKK